jgi:hypothetical protein
LEGNETLLEGNYEVDMYHYKVIYPLSGDPLPPGHKLILYREVPVTQEMDLTNQGALPNETLERAYDKLTLIAQQHDEAIKRSLKASLAHPGGVFDWPVPAPGKVVGWNADGTGMANYDNPGEASRIAREAADRAEAAAATVADATYKATPNTLIRRDANGRAKVAAPVEEDDIARKAEVDAHKAEIAIHRRIFIGYDEPLNTQEGDIWLDLNPPRKILADWRMLETVGEQVIDYSGNGYHGEIIGGVTRVPPINDGSFSALRGDGETGYVQTNFNALAGLDNFKVEVFVVINGLKPDATSDEAGWNGIVNQYRASGTTPPRRGYHISYDEWKDVSEPEVRKGRGFTARMVARNSDGELVDTNSDLYSYVYADFGDVYKLTFEFDGSIGIATFKVEKVLADGQLEQKWYGSSPLTGVVYSDANPLVLMASNRDIVDEYGNITLGRVTISTKVKW